MSEVANETRHQKKSESKYLLKCLVLFLVGFVGIDILADIVKTFILLFQNVPANETFDFIFNYEVTQSVYVAIKKPWYEIAVNAVGYLILLGIMVAILNKDVLKYLKSFKNGKAYLAGFIGLVLIMTFNNVYHSLVEPLYPVVENTNEGALDNIINIYPLLSIVIFGIVGPICEELTYRVGLYDFLKKINKVLAYVVTIIVFASIHFAFDSIIYTSQTGDATLLINELLNLPTYMFAAAVFIYLYDNYGLAGSLSSHMMNNLLSTFIQIIVYNLL